jgi:hypothetical protein
MNCSATHRGYEWVGLIGGSTQHERRQSPIDAREQVHTRPHRTLPRCVATLIAWQVCKVTPEGAHNARLRSRRLIAYRRHA